MRGKPEARQAWAVEQMKYAAKASANLGLKAHATFSGALAWPYIYPWPQRPTGLVEAAFDELSKRWRPILDAFDTAGCDLCYEIHPGEDLHDGATFEMFLERVGNHPRCNLLFDPSHFVLQQLDYLAYIDLYHDRIKMFHATRTPSSILPGEFACIRWLPVVGRSRGTVPVAGRRAGQFPQHLLEADPIRVRWLGCAGMGMLHQEPRAGSSREGAPFIKRHLIEAASRAFDDFRGRPGWIWRRIAGCSAWVS